MSRLKVRVPRTSHETLGAGDEGEDNLRRPRKAPGREHEKEVSSQDTLSHRLQKERLRSSRSVGRKRTGDPMSKFMVPNLTNHTNSE